jgi:hypothetical protein
MLIFFKKSKLILIEFNFKSDQIGFNKNGVIYFFLNQIRLNLNLNRSNEFFRIE